MRISVFFKTKKANRSSKTVRPGEEIIWRKLLNVGLDSLPGSSGWEIDLEPYIQI